ncbi:MAG: methylenetetrahydrofolate reductase [Actinomycetota bacterium]
MGIRSGSHLERVLHERGFAVTAEVVPPRSADPDAVSAQARALRGYADAANVTDSPTGAAHMSPVAGAALVAREGVEPTIQLTCRDRNRLAITGDLLGAWALGARNVLCLTGDPVKEGEHPEIAQVHDFTVLDLVRFTVRLRDEGVSLGEHAIDPAPRFFVGVADLPLIPEYDPDRLERKADAGADFVQTQIAYDADALGEWADRVRPLGVLERMFVLIGVAPPRSAASARFMRDHLPGVVVPDEVIRRLDDAEDGEAEGVRLTVEVVERLRGIDGIAGVHVMGLGHEGLVRRVIEEAGLLPRGTGPRT